MTWRFPETPIDPCLPHVGHPQCLSLRALLHARCDGGTATGCALQTELSGRTTPRPGGFPGGSSEVKTATVIIHYRTRDGHDNCQDGWLLVGGDWNMTFIFHYFSIYWEFPHPNWLIFFRGVGFNHQPDDHELVSFFTTSGLWIVMILHKFARFISGSTN